MFWWVYTVSVRYLRLHQCNYFLWGSYIAVRLVFVHCKGCLTWIESFAVPHSVVKSEIGKLNRIGYRETENSPICIHIAPHSTKKTRQPSQVQTLTGQPVTLLWLIWRLFWGIAWASDGLTGIQKKSVHILKHGRWILKARLRVFLRY